jgi:hypothetical protein
LSGRTASAFVWPVGRSSGDQALRIFKHLSISRTSVRRFLLCGLAALILQFATVEAHCPMVDCPAQPVKRNETDATPFPSRTTLGLAKNDQ